jgi:hypothetical protein
MSIGEDLYSVLDESATLLNSVQQEFASQPSDRGATVRHTLCRFLLGRQRDLVTQTFQAMHQVSREVVLVELV